jgi:GNAT superfamily N-acetyltransferase
MKRDFPANELAPFGAVRRNLEKNIYDGVFLTENSVDIGYALITAPANLKYALINYFAVFPEYRSKGYGSEFLKILIGCYSERTLVIEADDPLAAKTDGLYDEAARRVKFYERAGFNVIPTQKAKIFGVNYLIMASGNNDNMNAGEIMRSLYLAAFDSKLWLKFIDVK